LALPRLKIMAVKDHLWERIEGKWRRRTCPLGEGMVDLPRILSMLAAARFAGPISLHVEYATPDPVAAIARDAEFLARQIATAWPSGRKS
jgi:sugar phosphate isomerase/epimerase